MFLFITYKYCKLYIFTQIKIKKSLHSNPVAIYTLTHTKKNGILVEMLALVLNLMREHGADVK